MCSPDLVEEFVRAGLGSPNKTLVHVDGTTSLIYQVDDECDRFVEVRTSSSPARQQRGQYLCVARDGDHARAAVLEGVEAVRDWAFEMLVRMSSYSWDSPAPVGTIP